MIDPSSRTTDVLSENSTTLIGAILKTPPPSEMCLEDNFSCSVCGQEISADAMVFHRAGRTWHEECN